MAIKFEHEMQHWKVASAPAQLDLLVRRSRRSLDVPVHGT